MAAAKIGYSTGLFTRLARIAPGKWSLPLIFAGRHSLAFYLIHQPLLIACVWLFSQVWPPSMDVGEVRNSCEATCTKTNSEEFCAFYCVCMLDRLERENALDSVIAGEQSAVMNARLQSIAEACTAETQDRYGEQIHE
jgi:uncharacterized membrane protein